MSPLAKGCLTTAIVVEDLVLDCGIVVPFGEKHVMAFTRLRGAGNGYVRRGQAGTPIPTFGVLEMRHCSVSARNNRGVGHHAWSVRVCSCWKRSRVFGNASVLVEAARCRAKQGACSRPGRPALGQCRRLAELLCRSRVGNAS